MYVHTQEKNYIITMTIAHSLSLPLQREIIMSDDVIEGEEGDAPVISERVQVTNSIQYCVIYIVVATTYWRCMAERTPIKGLQQTLIELLSTKPHPSLTLELTFEILVTRQRLTN